MVCGDQRFAFALSIADRNEQTLCSGDAPDRVQALLGENRLMRLERGMREDCVGASPSCVAVLEAEKSVSATQIITAPQNILSKLTGSLNAYFIDPNSSF